MTLRVALIPGDGVGPEIVSQVKRVIVRIQELHGLDLNYTEVQAGDEAKKRYGDPLPEETAKEIDRADLILKGPVGETAMDVVVKLRQVYDMYANIRPAFTIAGVRSRYEKVDILIVRENTEDLYKGLEFHLDRSTTVAMKVITERASRRIAEVGLNYALRRRRKVTCVHKANVMRVTDGLFANMCSEVMKGKVEFSHMYVDSAAANLVRNPQQFDVIVTTNVYGDILSDEAAEIAGSLGIAPSANIGDTKSLFEPVHGAAFDIAGKGIANPTAFLLSLAMMYERAYELTARKNYLAASRNLRESINSIYREGKFLTPDVGGNSNIKGFVDRLLQLLG